MSNCQPCTGGACQGKQRWPELVGVKASQAKAIIERENPLVTVLYIGCAQVRNLDCCCNRVWLFVDAPTRDKLPEGKVCKVPFVG